MAKTALLVSKQLEASLARRIWRVEKSQLGEYRQLPAGFVPFATSSGKIFGNFLVDETLSSPIQVVNYSSGDSVINRNYISESIQRAWDVRKAEAEKGALDISEAAAFRLVNENFDGLPGIAIDLYGPFAILHLYSRHWLRDARFIGQALIEHSAKSWARPITGVYLADHIKDPLHIQAKQATARPGDAAATRNSCIAGRAAPGNKCVIVENGVKYNVALDSVSGTGLFMDQRRNRALLSGLFSRLHADSNYKPSLLNAFCYTSTFSLAATKAVPGLVTTNVEASSVALSASKANFELNGLNPEFHKFQNKDVFLSLAAMDNINAQYDVVVLDPPAFTRIRRPDGRMFTFSAANNYGELASLAAPLVAPGGFLVAFMNTRSVTPEKWESDIMNGISSIVDRKKELFEFMKFAEKRKQLRKVPDLRKKPRDKMLEKLAKEGAFSVKAEDVEVAYKFSKVEEWTQDVDFAYHENDPLGKVLHGIVLQRGEIPKGISLPGIAPPPPPKATTMSKPRPPNAKKAEKKLTEEVADA